MSESQDLEARVATLETQVRGDIGDLRQATTSSFNAMRADLNDLRVQVDHGFAQVDRGFMEVRGRLDATAAGQQQIVSLLNTLIAQGDQADNGSA